MGKHTNKFSWADVVPIGAMLSVALVCFWIQHKDHQDTINILTEELRQVRSDAANNSMQMSVVVESPSQLPIGLANNNPGNVKNKGWQGQTGSDEFGHAIFSHYEYGLRAIAVTLKNYQKKHGLKTLRSMMKRYCESNQLEYAKFISKNIGVGIDEEFDVMAYMPEVLKCIVKFETGEQPYPDQVFALAGIYTNYND